VNLLDATIGGTFDCSAGQFIKTNGLALEAGRAKITSDVFLSDNFSSQGEVELNGAAIGGNLYCYGGQFINSNADALAAGKVKIGGDANFDDQFKVEGKIILEYAYIAHAFHWQNIKSPETVILDLHQAKIGTLEDDTNSWPVAGSGRLELDNFIYDDIDARAPLNVNDRIRCLHLSERLSPRALRSHRSRQGISQQG
jgi:hypothetical protein